MKDIPTKLKPYFNGITMDEICSLDLENVLELLPMNIRGHARVFLNSCLYSRELSNEKNQSTINITLECPRVVNVQAGLTFDGQSKIAASFLGQMHIPGSIAIDKLVIVDPIVYLDISYCGLMDSDLIYIVKLVKTIPSLKILNLEGNRFMADEDKSRYYALELLGILGHVGFAHTEFASTSNIDFMKSVLASKVANKFIWVTKKWLYHDPNSNLELPGWQLFLKASFEYSDQEFTKLTSNVLEWHEEYYRLISRIK